MLHLRLVYLLWVEVHVLTWLLERVWWLLLHNSHLLKDLVWKASLIDIIRLGSLTDSDIHQAVHLPSLDLDLSLTISCSYRRTIRHFLPSRVLL